MGIIHITRGKDKKYEVKFLEPIVLEYCARDGKMVRVTADYMYINDNGKWFSINTNPYPLDRPDKLDLTFSRGDKRYFDQYKNKKKL